MYACVDLQVVSSNIYAWTLFQQVRIFFFKPKTAYEILTVTGVQTCALPISWTTSSTTGGAGGDEDARGPSRPAAAGPGRGPPGRAGADADHAGDGGPVHHARGLRTSQEIGRASCRKECRSRWSPYH